MESFRWQLERLTDLDMSSGDLWTHCSSNFRDKDVVEYAKWLAKETKSGQGKKEEEEGENSSEFLKNFFEMLDSYFTNITSLPALTLVSATFEALIMSHPVHDLSPFRTTFATTWPPTTPSLRDPP